MAAIDDLRLEAFRQCNEYVRSADTRKDAMLVLYAIVTVSALFLSGTQGQPDLYAPALICLALIGILLAILFGFFRGYHTGYLIQAEEIAALIKDKPPPPRDKLPPFLKWGTELAMYFLLSALVASNVFMALRSGWGLGVAVAVPSSLLLFVVLVCFCSTYLGRMDARKLTNNLPLRYRWLLYLLSEREAGEADNPETTEGSGQEGGR